MDVNKLLAMAMLEQTTLSSKDCANRRHVVPRNGALAYFLKQYPELAAKYQLTTSKPGTKPKPKKPHTDQTRGRSKSSQKSGSPYVGRRSASRISAKSHCSRDGKQSNRFSADPPHATASQAKEEINRTKAKARTRAKRKDVARTPRRQCVYKPQPPDATD